MSIVSPNLLTKTLDIAYQAGIYLQQFYQNKVTVHHKKDRTPVTEADISVSQFLTQSLSQLTPSIPILSEEHCNIPLSQRKSWQTYWLIDPLDGTQQFIDRTGQFSVVICLIEKGKPTLGIIHAPLLQKTYYATLGNGAYLLKNSATLDTSQSHSLRKINKKVSQSDRLIITIGTSNQSQILAHLNVKYHHKATFLQYGSSSLKAGLVAEGIADCYVRLGDTGEWDTAAAEIILSEIGGRIFDLTFQSLTYNQRETLINPHFVMVGNLNEEWQNIFHFYSRNNS